MTTNQIGIDFSRTFNYAGPFISGSPMLPDLGMIYEDELGAKYKFVLNGHSVAQTAGNFGTWDYNGAGLTLAAGPLVAVAGNNTIVFKPSTATLNLMAGVWMGTPAAASSTNTSGGWIQFKGICDVGGIVRGGTAPGGLVDGTVAISIGDSLKVVNATFAAVKDQATGTTPSFQNFAIALVAFSTASTALKKILLCADSVY